LKVFRIFKESGRVEVVNEEGGYKRWRRCWLTGKKKEAREEYCVLCNS